MALYLVDLLKFLVIEVAVIVTNHILDVKKMNLRVMEPDFECLSFAHSTYSTQ